MSAQNIILFASISKVMPFDFDMDIKNFKFFTGPEFYNIFLLSDYIDVFICIIFTLAFCNFSRATCLLG